MEIIAHPVDEELVDGISSAGLNRILEMIVSVNIIKLRMFLEYPHHLFGSHYMHRGPPR